jgi:hypothetical protein
MTDHVVLVQDTPSKKEITTRLSAVYNGPNAGTRAGEAVKALTDLGFSDVRISGATNAAPGPDLGEEFEDDLDPDDKFDTIVCPGGANGVRERFVAKRQWRWVRIAAHKVKSVKYVAVYETVLDAENNNAPGGRGRVVGYAPVVKSKLGSNGKYWFFLGDITGLAIPLGNSTLRNIRYLKLEALLDAEREGVTLEEAFRHRGGSENAPDRHKNQQEKREDLTRDYPAIRLS